MRQIQQTPRQGLLVALTLSQISATYHERSESGRDFSHYKLTSGKSQDLTPARARL